MSTTATPYGAVPVGHMSASGSFSGKMNHYPIITEYATLISYGDFVSLAVTGTIAKETGTTTMGAGLIGIFLGCTYTDPTTGQFTASQYWPAANAATDAKALVCDDPFVHFQMQGDGPLTQAMLQANHGVTVTAGTAVFGKSRNAVDVSDVAATETLPLRLVGFVDGPFSTVGDAYTDAIFRFNGYHLNLSYYAATPGTGLAIT
jgi:hypothetical protein